MEKTQLMLGDSEYADGSVCWTSPSNLAIVKYWGKFGNQLPKNPSISLTLSNAISKTSIKFRKRPSYSGGLDIRFLFEGVENEKFKNRIEKYLGSILEHVPFVKQLSLEIESENTFPHSSGIASSASAMSAIALGICSIENQLFKSLEEIHKFEEKASFLARLGSGSASRSIFDSWSLWGKLGSVEGSSDLYAIGIKDQVHKEFHHYHDDIFILSSKEKAVSSTAGHALMETNAYADIRFKEAKRQCIRLLDILKAGDVEAFGRLAEHEAMSLHALMMVSVPSFILMEGNTVEMIKRIRRYRKETKVPVYFSLDAGPNIHLLYPDSEKDKIKGFIEAEMIPLCVDGKYIEDEVGKGPKQIA